MANDDAANEATRSANVVRCSRPRRVVR